MLLLWVYTVLDLFLQASAQSQNDTTDQQCRFSPLYTHQDILDNSTAFENAIIKWESNFLQNYLSWSSYTGCTIDHQLVSYMTGTSTGLFYHGATMAVSTPKIEAYHIMLLTHVMAGNQQAANLLYPVNPTGAAQYAATILNQKLESYSAFNHTYPGFGGFLPTFVQLPGASDDTILPHPDWANRTSAADNGQLIWAVYGLVQILSDSNVTEYRQLGNRWATWFTYCRYNAKGVFMPHNLEDGNICAITQLVPGTYTYTSFQKYSCESVDCLANDPYSGEMMAFFIHFSGSLDVNATDLLWGTRSPYIQAINYTSIVPNTTTDVYYTVDYSPGLGHTSQNTSLNATVQKGLYFSSSEMLKLLFLPYRDVSYLNDTYYRGEVVRTHNSFLMGSQGLFDQTYNVTFEATTADGSIGHVYNAGVPSVSYDASQELDLVSPGAAWPVTLFDRAKGLVWYKNMLDANGMQSAYGAVDATRRDSSAVSAILSWESKAPLWLALLGGISDFVRDGMRKDGVYADFIEVLNNVYGPIFNESRDDGKVMTGNDMEIVLPTVNFNQDMSAVQDYTNCRLDN